MRKQKGITLIALVITIVVLLILAGVSITALTDEDKGVVKKAKEAAQKTEDAAEQEDLDIEEIMDYADSELKKGISLASQIDESNYGDYVNYSKDLGLNLNLEGETAAPKTDWRIFYKDGERVYLIAADYVPNTCSLLNASSAKMVLSGEYSLRWASVPTVLSEIARQDNIFGINTSSYVLNVNNINSKCASYLLDTEHWKNFVDTTVADYAIGGPTIEMYANSWNGKGYPTITLSNTTTGYKVNGINSSNMASNVGYSDNLYYPHKTYNGIGSENCLGYWLASPSADDVNGVMRVHCSGDIYQYTYYYGSSLSTRPVISLKIGTTAEQDANGVWQLD